MSEHEELLDRCSDIEQKLDALMDGVHDVNARLDAILKLLQAWPAWPSVPPPHA